MPVCALTSRGTIEDYITGDSVADTEDERLRQVVARHLVDTSGFAREEISTRTVVQISDGDLSESVVVHFLISLAGRGAMVVRYGPGSLVSRERPAVAIARLIEPCVIPIAVVTNGRDARVLDAISKELLGEGLVAIPTKDVLLHRLSRASSPALSERQRQAERRIVLAYEEIDRRCPNHLA